MLNLRCVARMAHDLANARGGAKRIGAVASRLRACVGHLATREYHAPMQVAQNLEKVNTMPQLHGDAPKASDSHVRSENKFACVNKSSVI